MCFSSPFFDPVFLIFIMGMPHFLYSFKRFFWALNRASMWRDCKPSRFFARKKRIARGAVTNKMHVHREIKSFVLYRTVALSIMFFSLFCSINESTSCVIRGWTMLSCRSRSFLS